MKPHGHRARYCSGCRCVECTDANLRDYTMRRGRETETSTWLHREELRNLLIELCPDGLTDDCPARRKSAA